MKVSARTAIASRVKSLRKSKADRKAENRLGGQKSPKGERRRRSSSGSSSGSDRATDWGRGRGSSRGNELGLRRFTKKKKNKRVSAEWHKSAWLPASLGLLLLFVLFLFFFASKSAARASPKSGHKRSCDADSEMQPTQQQGQRQHNSYALSLKTAALVLCRGLSLSSERSMRRMRNLVRMQHLGGGGGRRGRQTSAICFGKVCGQRTSQKEGRRAKGQDKGYAANGTRKGLKDMIVIVFLSKISFLKYFFICLFWKYVFQLFEKILSKIIRKFIKK